MPSSFIKTLLIDSKAKKLQELVDLAAKDRTPVEAKRYAAQAQQILDHLAELDEQILNFKATEDGGLPGGMDYREDAVISTAIIRYLTNRDKPASESEITNELIRGQFRGYKDPRKMAIRVGRCVRSYTFGKPSENPKIRVHNDLVGLIDWTDDRFE
jgi:hypothetical protein